MGEGVARLIILSFLITMVTTSSLSSRCVALMRNGEQPMKIVQNVFVADQKLRLYRDQASSFTIIYPPPTH